MPNNTITITPILPAVGNREDQTINPDEYLNFEFIDNLILSDIFSKYLSIAFSQPPKNQKIK